jgi:hypothetical protein
LIVDAGEVGDVVDDLRGERHNLRAAGGDVAEGPREGAGGGVEDAAVGGGDVGEVCVNDVGDGGGLCEFGAGVGDGEGVGDGVARVDGGGAVGTKKGLVLVERSGRLVMVRRVGSSRAGVAGSSVGVGVGSSRATREAWLSMVVPLGRPVAVRASTVRTVWAPAATLGRVQVTVFVAMSTTPRRWG